MKIAILTFHFADNFGAVLQTFALEKFLECRQHDVSIINFIPQEKIKSSFFVKSIKIRHFLGNVIRLFFYPFYLRRKILFQKFRNEYLKIGKRCSSSDIDFSSYDVILTGSDQTFNLNYSYTEVYYQQFEKSDFQKKIAYAPSFGSYDMSLLSGKMIDALKDFDSLSCRESNGAEYLSKILNRSVSFVLDPVFLLKKQEWTRFLGKKPVDESYIFVFDLNGKENLIKMAKLVNKSKKIIMYSNDLLFHVRTKNGKGISFLKSMCVEDFLTYIYYADLVLTDSFHCTAFSILLEKSFYTYIALEKSSYRIRSILKALDLTSRIISYNSIDENEIDYGVVSKLLTEKRLTSQKFLEQNGL